MSSSAAIKFSKLGARVQAPAITALMSAMLENPRMLSLAAGFTDNASLPVDDVSAAFAQLRARPGAPEYLQYGSNRGRPDLRRLLANRTAQRDGAEASDELAARTVVGAGSQQLLYLAMEVLVDPGDIVLVERPTYFVFLEMLAALGVRAISLPARPDGSYDFDEIPRLLDGLRASGETARVKAVYLMTYFGNPSGWSRSAEEKNQLAAALRYARLVAPIIEDAAYRELWFHEVWPAPSVLALDAWREFPRLYLGTLTKPFATGLKIGFGHCTDQTWFDRMCWLKGSHDFGSANFNQALLERVLESGAFDAHLVRLRPMYAAKMRALSEALAAAGLRELGWRWSEPAGGLYLWLEAPGGLSTGIGDALWEACLAEGVLYVPGGLCAAGNADRARVRLSFGVLDHDALREAAERFARAARRVASAAARPAIVR